MPIAQLHITCDDATLEDSVASDLPTLTGETPQIISAVHSYGWQMGNGYATFSGVLTAPYSAMTFGFWLKPRHPGVVTNPDTGDTESLLMPLMTQALFLYEDAPFSLYHALAIKFIIWEETQTDGTNKMKVQIRGPTSATLTSSSYSVDVFHYFWIAFDGSGPSLKIFVDLTEDTLATVSGTVPHAITASGQDFHLNYAVEGDSYQIARNTGILDDLIIFGEHLEPTEMARAALYGGAFLSDENLQTTEDMDQAFVFDDSSTIQINAVTSNRSNLFLARSDGKLLRGLKRIWQSRRNFGSDKEIELLDFVTTTGEGQLTTSDGSLVITNEIVTI